jgi:ATP-binding cassette subfamily B protein
VTALVGSSGSGKTTLLKLLLALYRPSGGEVMLGGVSLDLLDHQAWRARCGVVMQDGYIFSGSIARNIALGSEAIDPVRLKTAVELASLREYVESLPNGLHTQVGTEGQGLSGGQKQRILLARAVYRLPDFLFLDEATSALDARTESVVYRGLREFAAGRTVVVIAHRLSTVREADQIVVLDRGQIVERGNHAELVSLNGAYFQLVRNQLELDAGSS